MERRTQNRTPKRLLSVFLSILMVLSAVVVGNPFTAEAASTVTYKPLQTGGRLDAHHYGYVGHAYNYDLFEDGEDYDRDDFEWYDDYTSEPDEDGNYDKIAIYDDVIAYGVHRNYLFYVYSVYDYNPNAQNQDTYVQVDVPDKALVGSQAVQTGYDEDAEEPIYDWKDVYMYAGSDYDKILRYNPSSGYCAPNATDTSYITTENRFSNSGYSEFIKELNESCKNKVYGYRSKYYYRFDGENSFPTHDPLFNISWNDDYAFESTHQVIFQTRRVGRCNEPGTTGVYYFPGIITYPVNTSKITEYYDLAMSKYGKTNKYYTAESWSRYIEALAAAENIVNNGVHLRMFEHQNWDPRPENIADPQREVYNIWTALKDAINALVALPTNITYVNNVEGAKVEGPSTATPGNNISVTLRLEDSHSKSPDAGINIRYTDGTSKNFTVKSSGSRNGNTITLTIPLEGFEPTITPINIAKNTYKVTLQNGAGGLQVLDNKGGKSFDIQHNGSFEFRIRQLTGYTSGAPVVKVNNVEIGGVGNSDNTIYSYKIEGITEPKNITISNKNINTYKVDYSLGEGASKAGDSATAINHFGSATVKITVDGAHNQVTSLPISVTNGTISGGTKSGNTFTYTLSNVTANTTVKVADVAKNIYTVNIPEGDGYSLDRKSMRITDGDNFDFTVTLDSAHSQTPPEAYLAGKELTYTKVGTNGYKFNTGAVYAHGDVTISNIKINYYGIELPADTDAFKVTDVEGFNHASIKHGDSYKFTVTVDKAYTQNSPKITLASGKKAELVEFGIDGEYNTSYTYEITNVTANDKITVDPMEKNTYSAVLPFDADGSYKVTNAKANAENVVESIVYGTDLTFGVAFGEQYNRSEITVKYKDTVLKADEAGNYTISNITANIVEGDIVVEGVKLNNYYITLPIDSESGFTIEVGEGLNAKAVKSGTDFNFKLFLDPAYSNSKPIVKYSAKGGADNDYKLLEANGNEYTIKTVLSDCIVLVQNVEKNTYTVKFVDESGNLYEPAQTVEYGKDAVYGKNGGMMPSKDALLVSDNTVDGVRTVVTKEYKFIGWSQETTNVTSNMTVTPIFEVSEVTKTYPKEGGEPSIVVTPKTANVIFLSDGLIVHKESIEKGTKFSGWNGTPVKTSKNPYETYTFLGWDIDKDGAVDFAAGEENAIDAVNEDVTFVAVFESNLPSQTVTFKSWNGEQVLYTASVKRGEEARYGLSMIPSRTDKKYEYTFEGWSYEMNADEKNVLDKLVVAENDITVYAAYSKEIINYTYKFVNDGVELQKGSYNFVTSPEEDTVVKFTGETPERASTKDKVFTFDGWKATTPSRYSTVYEATYTSETREYGYTLPTVGGATVALGEGIGETVKFGENLVFTVTLDEGHDQNAPVVKSNGEILTGEQIPDSSTYVYVINADGADADEIKAKLNEITAETTINKYTVDVVKATNEGGNKDASCTLSKANFETDYNGEVVLVVTLSEGYTQTAPVLTAAEGNRVEITRESQEGNTYTYKLSGVKSNATITVTTKINEYAVKVLDWNDEVLFDGNVKHGYAPKFTRPERKPDANGNYGFLGYDTDNDKVADVGEIKNVTAPVTAKAVYKYNHHHDTDPDENPDIWKLVETEKATCTKDGLKHYICRHGDGQTTTKVIPARRHNFTEWHIDKAPTCTETGLKSRHCQNTVATDEYEACSYAENGVVIPATGHHDSDGDYKCDDCGADLGHCSSCICHKGNVLSKVIRKICTLLSKTFHTKIKCCKCMEWYGDKISSIS